MDINYYKYVPISRLSYLKNELFRFTQAGDLNDPFECLPAKPNLEMFTSLIDSLIPFNANKQAIKNIKYQYNSDYLDNLYKTQCEKVNDDIGVFSLSKNWNNSLMWAHYTESHKGFCVGFDSKHNFFLNYLSTDKKTSKTIKDVVYSDKRVEIPMTFDQADLGFEPFITKSLDWKYEEEIRIIASLALSDNLISGSPYNIYLFKVPHSAINEIILGANIEAENEKIIRLFASQNNIKLYKAKKSEVLFDLERE